MARHLLLVRLGRELLYWKEALDERWGVLEREGYDCGLCGSGGLAHILFSKGVSSKSSVSTGRRRRFEGAGASPSASAKCSACRQPR